MTADQSSSPKVVQLSDFRNTSQPARSEVPRHDTTFGGEERLSLNQYITERDKPTASLSDVYPGMRDTAPEFYAALTSLTEMSGLVSESLKLLEEGYALLSDDLISRLILELPKIFINVADNSSLSLLCTSLFHSLRNKRGIPLDRAELVAVHRFLDRIAREPFMSMDQAITLIEDLDEVGFDFMPEDLQTIMDGLADEGVR